MIKTVTLTLTSEELDLVFDALEEVRLADGWEDDNSAELADQVQDKIFEVSKAFYKE